MDNVDNDVLTRDLATTDLATNGLPADDLLLDISNLSVTFGSGKRISKAVDKVSIQVKHSEVVAVVGESGSGKSVTMKALMGLLPDYATVTADYARFNGQDLLAMKGKARRAIIGNDISMIFQDAMSSLNPSFTVEYQIAEVLRTHLGMKKSQTRERIIELLDLVGIPDPQSRLEVYPHQLSGGMSQRVMIAMAMACEPKLLIADEPTTALDVTIQAQVLDLMNELKDKKDTSILFITHDLGVVKQMADRVVVMYRGHVVERASAEEIFYDPRHPYTQALLNSIPRPGKVARKSRLSTIDENVDYLQFPTEIR